MIDPPGALLGAVSAAIGARIVRASPIGGGMINNAARIETPDAPLFLKWTDSSAAAFYAVEADGLRRLRETGCVRVPEVVAFEDAGARGRSFLVMEWIDTPARVAPDLGLRLAADLAALHQTALSPSGEFGLERNNLIGTMIQRNRPHATWGAFYRDERLGVQMSALVRGGHGARTRVAMLERLMEVVEDALDASGNPPALVHGDLWSGNILATDRGIALVDPAVYYADREVELAYLELFGGAPPGFMEAYTAAYPLADGYEARRPILQVYPLMVHVNHFGAEYGPMLDERLRAAVG